MAMSEDDNRNLFGLLVRVARVEERLIAQDEREEYREEMLKHIIRDAVSEGLQPVHKRLDAIEKDVTRAKAYGAAIVFLAGVAAWVAEHVPGLKP